MDTTIVYDCEFLAVEGAPARFWCGPYDPDPVIAQIGAVKLGLRGDFPIRDTLRTHVIPKDRFGARYALDPFFSALTGITEKDLDEQGVPLAQALRELSDFASGATLWSWGKDEFNLVAISCYVAGIAAPLPATRFANAAGLLLKAGMPHEDIKTMRSNRLADYFGVEHPPLRGHDALDDALSVAYVLQHLLRTGALTGADCERGLPAGA